MHPFQTQLQSNCIITNDACQPQMDPPKCYFEDLIMHTENLTISFDRHTLQ